MTSSSDEAAAVTVRRILLVEDDDALRRLFTTALLSEGYIVEAASTGDEAVAAFTRQCPDLLLSDLVLPGPNGEELARLCRECCPDTILVFMSGYTAEELHQLDITQVVFIPKPIQPRDLLATLARLFTDPNPHPDPDPDPDYDPDE
jgi:two-component system, cell cycle sensor histidine kinase and response regulator CckA